jgi:entericidin A
VAHPGPNRLSYLQPILQQGAAGCGTNLVRRSLIRAGRHAFNQEIPMRKLMGIAVVAATLMVSACNTIEGVGRDVSSAGDTVAKTANGAK